MSLRAFRLFKYWMILNLVNAIVNASIAWWRWSLRFVQSLMRRTSLPSFLNVSISPNSRYLGRFSSCMTLINCQSSRSLSVIFPVVGTTTLTICSKISRAFLAIYCVSRKSRMMKSSGISSIVISNLSCLAFPMVFCLSSSSILFLYAFAPSSPYFPFT